MIQGYIYVVTSKMVAMVFEVLILQTVVLVGSCTNKRSEKRIVIEVMDFVKSFIAKSFVDIKNIRKQEVAITLQEKDNWMEQIELCLIKVQYQDTLN